MCRNKVNATLQRVKQTRVQNILQNEFQLQFAKDPYFSVRSFARMLEIDSSSLSKILSGQRTISTKLVHRICDKLHFGPKLRGQLLGEIHGQSTEPSPYHQMTTDTFAVISEWYHFAILELTYVEDFKNSPRWIAKKLGLRPAQAKLAVQRLLRLGLLKESKGQLIKTHASLTNYSEGITSSAHRHLQLELLNKAISCIETVKPANKDITSMTMAIDLAKMPQAKKRILKFRRDMCKFLESGLREEVYSLSIQLYPLTVVKNKNMEKRKNK